MNPIATHTKHGRERHIERFRMPMKKLCKMLDSGGYHDLGKAPGSFREYRLVYSPEDKAFIVVVQDENSGRVVTVWRPHMFELMIKKLKDVDYEEAKRKYDSQQIIFNSDKQVNFVIACAHNTDGVPKVKHFEALPGNMFQYNFEILASSNVFSTHIKEECKLHGIDMRTIDWISVKLGEKSNTYQVYNWEKGRLTGQ